MLAGVGVGGNAGVCVVQLSVCKVLHARDKLRESKVSAEFRGCDVDEKCMG